MHRLNALSIVLASSLACATAVAGPSANMTVSGTIISSACTASVAYGGGVDYKDIQVGGLEPGANKHLGKRQIGLRITCKTPLKVGFKVTDNRAQSRVPGITGNLDDSYNYGLGQVGDKKIGGYSMSMPNDSLADFVEVRNLYSSDNGARWSNGAKHLSHKDYIFAVGGRNNLPISFRWFQTTIEVEAILNRPEDLPLAQAVSLDGSASFEVIYL